MQEGKYHVEALGVILLLWVVYDVVRRLLISREERDREDAEVLAKEDQFFHSVAEGTVKSVRGVGNFVGKVGRRITGD